MPLNAQRTCKADEYLAHRLKNDEKFALRFNQYQQDKINPSTKSLLSCNNTNSVVVPVAVHYFSPVDCTNKQCLLDAAYAQISVLNESFSASNNDLSYYTDDLNNSCPSSYPLSRAPQIGEGTCIQFCLATENHPPNSGLSDGEPAITMNQHTWPSSGTMWSGYLNIFVSDGASAGQSGSTLGISALPGNADGDGFWVNHTVFGGPNFSCISGVEINGHSNFDLGRTAVHEAGHYFGLYHVFQGSDCDDDDSDPPGPIFVNDTPAQNAPHYGCPSVSSCADAPSSCTGAYDNFYSFMDYSNDDCMVMFTADQSQVINYWANFHTWKDSTIVCSTVSDVVNCNGPSCSDGIQNGSESGIDCGGLACAPCNYTCGETLSDTGGSADYFNNENVTWTICATGTQVVALSFTDFEVEEGGSTGCFDKLELYDGPDANANSLGVFCGYSIADSPGAGYIQSSGNCITLNFISDNSIVKNGWTANITCQDPASCDDGIQNGDETGVDCGGSNCNSCPLNCDEVFYDTGGGSGNYDNGESQSFLYCPDSFSEVVRATFIWSDIEATSGNGNNGTGCWDILKVYDGPTDSEPMIGNYCGEESGDGDVPGDASNNLYVGKIFQSTHSSGCLYFTFQSDNSINETGWEAEVACIQATLPVELTDFYVIKNDNNGILHWETSVEINNEGFYIERSSDMENFESIAFVRAVTLPTNSNQYKYVDEGLSSGKYYYRLRQVDLDGSTTYSKVESLHIDENEEGQIKFFPNPFSDLLQIDIPTYSPDQSISVKIYDRLGKLVFEDQNINTENGVIKLSLSELAQGSYFVCVQTASNNHIEQISKI